MPHHGEAVGPPKYTDRIFNSNGHHFAPIGANINEAIQDLPATGGKIQLPPDLLYIDDPIVIDRPVSLHGAGMTWSGVPGGTCLLSTPALALQHMITYDEDALIHFGGIYDMTLNNTHGRNTINIISLADAHFERIFLNHAAYNGIYIEGSELSMWNFWIKDCLFENITLAGIRGDCADHVINKVHILDNYFFANQLGISFNQFVETGGEVRNVNIRGNHIYEMDRVGIHLWKDCNHISISDNLLRECGLDAVNTYNGIRIGDGDVAGDRCQWLSLKNNIIDGQAVTKWGIGLEDSTDRVLVLGNIIHGCATAPYNAEVGVTNVEKAHNIEV